MAGLELLTVQATAPGTGAAMAAAAGNSLTFKETGKKIHIIDIWQTRQAAGSTRILHPNGHDAIVGFAGAGPIGYSHLFRGWEMEGLSGDVLTVTGIGSAVGGDIESSSMLVWYEQLQAVNANLIDAAELERRGEDVYSFTATLALGTAGGYSGSELITAEQDQLKGQTEYAWVGTTVQVPCHAVRMNGPDFGNVGIGMPAPALASSPGNGEMSSQFWRHLAKQLNAPLIPVINSANKSLTTVDGVTDENGTDVVSIFTMIRLAPRGRR